MMSLATKRRLGSAMSLLTTHLLIRPDLCCIHNLYSYRFRLITGFINVVVPYLVFVRQISGLQCFVSNLVRLPRAHSIFAGDC